MTRFRVMDRTGHTTSDMVNRYGRKARSWRLGELGPLNTCIPELGECPRDCPQKSLAKVAELADAPDSGSGGVTPVGVQVPSFAP
jgi:hypothetical protein